MAYSARSGTITRGTRSRTSEPAVIRMRASGTQRTTVRHLRARIARNPALNRLLLEIRQQIDESLAENQDSGVLETTPPTTTRLWRRPLNRLNRMYLHVLDVPGIGPQVRWLSQEVPSRVHTIQDRYVPVLARFGQPWTRLRQMLPIINEQKNTGPAPKNVSVSLARGAWILKVDAAQNIQNPDISGEASSSPAVGLDLGFIQLQARFRLQNKLPFSFLGISFGAQKTEK